MNRPVVRELVASINRREIGSLRDDNGMWSFEYRDTWIDDPQGFDLSPHLARSVKRIADSGSDRPVQWFFDNLLPEEGERDLLAREARISSADAFGLLGYFGKESAGAMTITASGEAWAEQGLRPLSQAELHERIAQLPTQSLSSRAPKRMSLAGGQHKLAVCLQEGELFEPIGDTPSTHIIKPDHRRTEHYPNSVANEYFVMSLAARVGLRVPQVEIRYVPDPIYLIERFDREAIDGEVRRLHIIDACQLLGLDKAFKYRQSNVESLVQCVERCTNRAQSRLGVLQWVLFNTLLGNGDAHLKNLSFHVNSTGIELAPFYDLLSTECYRGEIGNHPRWPETPLSLRLGKAETFAQVTRENFLAFAAMLGVTRRAALRLLDEFTANLADHAATLYREFEDMKIPEKIVRASQLRTLSQIRSMVIVDMLDSRRLGSGGRVSR